MRLVTSALNITTHALNVVEGSNIVRDGESRKSKKLVTGMKQSLFQADQPRR
uniref:Uncharacterized protein n=1 Tax=Arundo donax TaxID=35708 RepID=A0A0A9CC00_ARUDO